MMFCILALANFLILNFPILSSSQFLRHSNNLNSSTPQFIPIQLHPSFSIHHLNSNNLESLSFPIFHSGILLSPPGRKSEGFFSTGSRASPGNYGLKDIVQALRWVQENIRSFNGNPKKVTLWGHSAGAAAIHMLALNKKTEGLFNRYILQSGFAVSPWAMNPRSLMRRVALDTANHLHCLPSKRREKEDKECKEMGNETSREKERAMYTPDVAISGSGMEDGTEKYSEEEEEEMMKCLRNVKVEELGNILDRYYVRKYFFILLYEILRNYSFFSFFIYILLENLKYSIFVLFVSYSFQMVIIIFFFF